MDESVLLTAMSSKIDDTDSYEKVPLYRQLKRYEQIVVLGSVGLSLWAIIRLAQIQPSGQKLFAAILSLALPGALILSVFYKASNRRERQMTDW